MMLKNKIEIIQTKSAIGYNVKVKKTLEALGIKKINHKIIKDNNDSIRGMISKVSHLIEYKEL